MVPIQHLKLYLGWHSSCARLGIKENYLQIENCEPSTYVGIGCPSDTNGMERNELDQTSAGSPDIQLLMLWKMQ
jgi:hypothetical protein